MLSTPARAAITRGWSTKRARHAVQRLLSLVIVVLVAMLLITRVAMPIVDGRHTSATLYVVKRGDTLVSIAEQVDPNANPYPIVAQLEKQTHGTLLFPGERIVVPTAGR
ncbi:MAG: LysM peptidoglycan-binding domain-containing protein [Ferrimicrobium sp.]